MTGRKVRASPPGLGRATITETCDDRGVYEASQKLLGAFRISGPVALEFKRDNQGQYWFIEANVGRTEFCVDLPVQAGFNLPHVEFRYALGDSLPAVEKVEECIWYDTVKEPFSYVNLCATEKTIRPHGKRQVFPYWRQERPTVLVVALFWTISQLGDRVLRKPGSVHRSPAQPRHARQRSGAPATAEPSRR